MSVQKPLIIENNIFLSDDSNINCRIFRDIWPLNTTPLHLAAMKGLLKDWFLFEKGVRAIVETHHGGVALERETHRRKEAHIMLRSFDFSAYTSAVSVAS